MQPGKPRLLTVFIVLSTSVCDGMRRYSSAKSSFTPLAKRFILSMAKLSDTLQYSSSESADAPYASILMAAVVFWKEDFPKRPVASAFCTK